jgi:threonine dehydrogenase-like Zn-dependent dehydrogenase
VRALTIHDDRASIRADVDEPEVREGWALVRPTSVLVTPSDLAPSSELRIPGRRFVGVVEICEDPELVGTRVVGESDLVDPQSELARRGLAQHDPSRRVLGTPGAPGCLADRVAVPLSNLCVVPRVIDDEHAVLAGELSAALHVARQERVANKTYVSVIGADLLALLCAQLMSAQNASVRLVTTNESRLELCAKWGIRHRDLDHVGRRADQDIVIDTSTEPGSLEIALRMARPRGAIILCDSGSRIGAVELDLVAQRELRVLGSRAGPISDGIRALTSGTLDLSGLVTKRVRFEDLPGELRLLRDPDQISMLVRMD